MFISPYDTTVGTKLKGIDRIRTAIEVAYVGGLLSAPGEESGVNTPVLEVIGNKNTLDDIPSFGHPLVIKTVMDGQRVVVDQRAYARTPTDTSRPGSRTTVVNEREYNFLQSRAYLQVGWESLGTRPFERLGPIPMRVFCDWISGQITQRLGLDLQQRRDVAIITAWYYLCLFKDSLTNNERLTMVRAIQTTLRYDFASIGIATENLGYIPNMAAFVTALKESNISPRLNTLTQALLFEITAYSWVGGYSKEVAGIALEHPPTFILLCSAADHDRGYRDTVLARLMADQRRLARDVNDFQANMKYLLEACRGVERF